MSFSLRDDTARLSNTKTHMDPFGIWLGFPRWPSAFYRRSQCHLLEEAEFLSNFKGPTEEMSCSIHPAFQCLISRPFWNPTEIEKYIKVPREQETQIYLHSKLYMATNTRAKGWARI